VERERRTPRPDWRARQPSVYGRFDLAYDGRRPPKLLEYNADTPTALFEASVAQWFWLQDIDRDKDQFNSIHERLIARWKEIAGQLPAGENVHFACAQESPEDYVTTEYLRDTADQAGLQTVALDIADIGLQEASGAFVDLEGEPIRTLFKLYPWEWLVREEFGARLPAYAGRLIEPAWKLVLSNKGILPILWELFPRHPNLLPAYFTPEPLGASHVRKPLLSREGANVSIVSATTRSDAGGPYGDEGYVYQALHLLPCFDDNHTVVGSWVIGDESAGIGIREDNSPITRNTSRFVPHYFE
jgi:glutathionylspermidine synthase